jgi:hypothetical protein
MYSCICICSNMDYVPSLSTCKLKSSCLLQELHQTGLRLWIKLFKCEIWSICPVDRFGWSIHKEPILHIKTNSTLEWWKQARLSVVCYGHQTENEMHRKFEPNKLGLWGSLISDHVNIIFRSVDLVLSTTPPPYHWHEPGGKDGITCAWNCILASLQRLLV